MHGDCKQRHLVYLRMRASRGVRSRRSHTRSLRQVALRRGHVRVSSALRLCCGSQALLRLSGRAIDARSAPTPARDSLRRLEPNLGALQSLACQGAGSPRRALCKARLRLALKAFSVRLTFESDFLALCDCQPQGRKPAACRPFQQSWSARSPGRALPVAIVSPAGTRLPAREAPAWTAGNVWREPQAELGIAAAVHSYFIPLLARSCCAPGLMESYNQPEGWTS
jgi:hypothetical protein